MNEWKKLISLNLALAMLIGLIQPLPVYAVDDVEALPVNAEQSEVLDTDAVLILSNEDASAEELSTDEPIALPEASGETVELLDQTTEGTSGTCGSNLAWTLDEDGVLTISGTGAMSAYNYNAYPWYSHSAAIQKVVVEEGVTSIAGSAFYYYYDALTEVSLPSTLTSIGEQAFQDADALASVMIPGTVTSIGTRAFYGCDALTTVTVNNYRVLMTVYSDSFPSNALVTYLTGTAASGMCGANLYWTLADDGTLTISGTGVMYDYGAGGQPWNKYMSNLTKVVVEEGVTELDDAAFSGAAMTSASLPSTLTAISSKAFYSCDGLASIDIPDNVTSIGDSAFYDCDGLTEIVISEGVTSIGNSAFYDCDKLTEIIIPDGVTSINSSAFEGCIKLANVTLGTGLTSIPACMFYNCDALTEITIPAGVTSVGYRAFYDCDGLTTAVIPGSVTTWGSYSDYGIFEGCSKLASVALGEGLTSIPAYMFENCVALADAAFPSTLQSIGSSAFYSCAMSALALPDSVKTIGSEAFRNISELTDVTIGSGIETIGSMAFAECPYLAKVDIDNYEALVSVASDAFPGSTTVNWREVADDTILRSWTVSDTIRADLYANGTLKVSGTGAMPDYYTTSMPWYSLRSSIQCVIVDEGITTVGDYAFYNHPALTEVTISGTVNSIGFRAFDGCAALTTVAINNYEFAVFVDDSAFPSTATITYLPLPETANGTCGDDLTWTLTDGVLTISGTGAMTEYSRNETPWLPFAAKIQKVVVSEGVTTISANAFSNYTSSGTSTAYNGITELALPSTLKSIGSYAFYSCDGLVSVAIPEGVEKIGYHVFSGCSALVKVSIPGTVKTWETYAIATAGYTEYNNCAFSGCTELKYVIFGDGLAEIPEYAFYNCQGLTTLEIPSSITTIGAHAFYKCSNLTAVTINTYQLKVTIGTDAFPSSTTITYTPGGEDEVILSWEVGDYDETDATAKLYGSGKLVISGTGAVGIAPWRDNYWNVITEVVVEDGITSLPSYSFENCDALVSADLGSMTSVASELFESCDSLTTVTGLEQVTSIGAYAFYNCKALADVGPLWNVKTIGNHAFRNCTALTALNGLGYVTNVSYYAFAGCTALTEMSLPAVKEIGNYAFSGCTALKQIYLGAPLQYLYDHAFYNCTALEIVYWYPEACYDLGESSYAFLNAGTAGEGITLKIGTGVQQIPAYLFYTSSGDAGSEPKLTTIEVEINGILSRIGNFAFYRCVHLMNLELGNALEEIGDGAFNTCASLAAVTLPATLETLGTKAFFRTGLLTVNSGEQLTSIGDNAFAECPAGLTVYGVSGSTMEYYCSNNSISFVAYATSGSVDGISWALDTATGKLTLSGSGELTVSPAPWSGYGDSITSVTMGPGISTLKSTLFDQCPNLESVTFEGNQPVLIDSNGTSTTVPFAAHDNMTVYRPADASWPNTWSNCTVYAVADTMVSVTLHDNFSGGISQILSDNGGMPFNLTDYTTQAQERYLAIDDTALLTGWSTNVDGTGTVYGPNDTIILNADMTLYAQWTVATYAALTLDGNGYNETFTVRYLAGTQVYLKEYSTEFEEGYLDSIDGVSLTGWNTAKDGTGVNYNVDALIVLDADLTLYAQWEMPEVTIKAAGTCGDDLTWTLDTAGVLTISGTGEMEEFSGTKAIPWYTYRASITKLVISEGVTTISPQAFWNQYNLTSVSLPESLTEIGESAFYNCYRLPAITIPNGVESIYGYAFESCDALTTVVIGSGLRYIDEGIFSDCTALTSVTIGAPEVLVECEDWWIDDTSIVTWAKGDDNTIANQWYVGAYDETDALATLYTSGKLVISGQGGVKAGGWRKVLTVVIEDGITSVGNSMFNNCESLTTVTLGQDVAMLESYAFRGCTSLVTVEGLNNVTDIGNRAFYNCTALEKVSFSQSLYYIGSYAFYGSGLTSAEIYGKNIQIGIYAFSNCPALTSVLISGTVTQIGQQAFANCPVLNTVKWDTGTFNGLSSSSHLFLNSGKEGPGIKLYPYGTHIPAYLFYTSSNYAGQEPYLTHISRHNKYTETEEIGAFAFYRCVNLENVNLSPDLLYIADGAFNSCSALTELSLPSSLCEIGTKAFYLSGLNKLELGRNVCYIGTNAFGACAEGFTLYGYDDSYAETYANANSIPFIPYPTSGTIDGMTWNFDMETGILSISGNGALTDTSCPWICHHELITEIQLSEGITEIGANVFAGCDEITAITLPASLASLNNKAFSGCYSLDEVYFLGSTPRLMDGDGETTTAPFAASYDMMVYYQADAAGWADCGWTNCTLAVFTPVIGSLTLHDNNGHSDYSEVIPANVGKLVNLKPYSKEAQARYADFAELVEWNSAADGSGESYAANAEVAIAEDLHLYAQWEILNFTIDGQAYPMGTAAEGNGWAYDGGDTLSLNGYNGGGIALPYSFMVSTSGNNTIHGSIVSESKLVLDVCDGTLDIESAETAITAENFTLYAYGTVCITSSADTALSGAKVRFYGDKDIVISAASKAVSYTNLFISNHFSVYLSADSEAEVQDSYDDGSYLKLNAKVWETTLHANGGTWTDQASQEKIVETPIYEVLYLASYAERISREGYALDGWCDLDDNVEYAVSGYASSGNMILYAIWAEEALIVDGSQYSPKSACSGDGWSFVPASGDTDATLTITDGYGGGRIYCTEDLIINVTGTVDVASNAGYPAIDVLGSLELYNNGMLKVQGGAGANGIEVQKTVVFRNEGDAAVYGGEGGAGIAATDTMLSSTNQLAIVGGLRAPALNSTVNFSEHKAGQITLVGGYGSTAVSGNSVTAPAESMKYYAGSNANTAARRTTVSCVWNYAYVRIQPKTIIITFHANGGDMNGELLTTMELHQDANNAFILESDVQPTLLGYSFDGWNTAADGTGSTYMEGEVYSTEDAVDTVTLYAQWSPEDLEAQFNADGTQALISLSGENLEDMQLLLVAYTETGKMLQCAYGERSDLIWTFAVSDHKDAFEWKLFYLKDDCAPTQDARYIVFSN